MEKIEPVANMAAAIYVGGPARQLTFNPDEMFERVAAQAWSLYDAVEKLAAERHSRR